MTQEQKKKPVVIYIQKETIENCDCDYVMKILDSYIPERSEQNRNNVVFEIEGYGDDAGNIWEIAGVRQYFKKLFDAYKGLFYWVDLDSPMFIFLALILYTPVEKEDGITIPAKDLQQYLTRGFTGLNEFCEENNLSAEPSTKAIRQYLGMDQH